MACGKDLIIPMSLDGHLCLPVSKTFVRSMKAAKSGCHCSLHFCYSCRRENTISMVDLLARETHCNSGYSLRQNLEPLQCYSGEKLLNDGKERDATVVIVVTFIAFVLVECDDVCIPHVLWYFTLSSAEIGFHTTHKMMFLLQLFRTSARILSFSGALLEARE